MKIVAVVSTLDLKYRLGCTPAWWQLLKALHETENEVVVIPYLGKGIETLWWHSSSGPTSAIGDIYYHFSNRLMKDWSGDLLRAREKLSRLLAESITLPLWRRSLLKIMRAEKDVDAVIFFNVPLNQIRGIAGEIRRLFSTRILFYDGDMPTILPENFSKRGFMFDYYRGADLSEFDLFLVNSEGVIQTLKNHGAKDAKALHYGADLGVFHPVKTAKKWDVAFFGYGSRNREKWMTRMISEPSIRTHLKFVIGGGGFDISTGNASLTGDVGFSSFRHFCCSAKVNLNITRESHTSVFASSTARPFELAAMGCCIVSCPYNGIERWFRPEKELLILSEDDDPSAIYESIITDSERREELGEAARLRVQKDHTYMARACQLTDYIKSIR